MFTWRHCLQIRALVVWRHSFKATSTVKGCWKQSVTKTTSPVQFPSHVVFLRFLVQMLKSQVSLGNVQTWKWQHPLQISTKWREILCCASWLGNSMRQASEPLSRGIGRKLAQASPAITCNQIVYNDKPAVLLETVIYQRRHVNTSKTSYHSNVSPQLVEILLPEH